MTPTTKIAGKRADQLKNSLDGLENALNLRKVGIWVENTTDPGFGQLQSTFSFGFVVEGMEQMVLLAYKENNDARREIVLLTTPQQDTTIKEERLVVWQLEEIAKEFCKSRRLIADLIKCGDQAQVIFSNIQSLVAEYDCFHSEDYEEEGHIVIRVTVSSDQDTAFKEYETYNKWMMENITDEGLEHFVVVVRRIG